MNKLKLLVTASLLVGGGVFALSAADGVTSAKAATNSQSQVVLSGQLQEGWETYNDNFYQGGDYYGVYGGNYITSSNYFSFNSDSIIDISMDLGTYGGTKGPHVGINVFAKNLAGEIVTNTLTFTPNASSKQEFEGVLTFSEEAFIDYESLDCSIIFESTSASTKSKFTRIYNASISNNKVTYNTIFNFNYDNSEDVIVTTEENELVTFPQNPFREGYEFDGWFTQPTGGEKVLELICTENITLYAHWSESNKLSAITTKTSLNVEYGLIDGIESKTITFGDIFNDETLDPIDSDSPTFDFAEAFGLSNYFEFIGDKGTNNIGPRIWKGKEFRTYSGNNLTIKPKNGFVITSANLFEANDTKGVSFVSNDDGSLLLKNTGEFVRFEFSFESKVIGATDASIRFGATLDAEKYYVDGATYGVVISAGTTSFDETLNKSNNYETFKTNLPQSHFEEIIPVYVNDENDLEASETGKYIQFAAVITGLLEHKDMELTAAAYRVVDGTIELMHEKTYSVVSLAKEYISRSEELALTDEHITILNSIVGE